MDFLTSSGLSRFPTMMMKLGYGASSVQKIRSLAPADCGIGCIYIYITAASPNKRSLGTTNGLALTLVSIGRMLAPAVA